MKNWQKNLLVFTVLLGLSSIIGYIFRPYSILFLVGAWAWIGGAWLLVVLIKAIARLYYKMKDRDQSID